MKMKILALVLCLSLLLTGCGAVELLNRVMAQRGECVKFSEMEYERPSEERLQETLDQCIKTAAEAESIDDIMDEILAFYDEYDWCHTAYSLSEIHYCEDLTDKYWEEERTFCQGFLSTLDQSLDTLYRALAVSPCREELEGEDYFGAGFFDAYEGESLYDETFLGLLERESELVNQYYTLYNQDTAESWEDGTATWSAPLEELFVDMVEVRQEIADYAGYDSYPQFAYDWYFSREYTPEQAGELMGQIQQKLVPLYRDMEAYWNEPQLPYSEFQTLGYVRNAAKAMGGEIEAAFGYMEEYELYSIGQGRNRYDAAFEVYLPSYGEPYVFMNPTGSVYDALSLTHEFGHFCNDFASYGSGLNTDVAEVFSQGLEYLSLCYSRGPEIMERMRMQESLSCYVEQSAYAAFEDQVYSLTGDELTTENLSNLFAEICEQYGMGGQELEGWEYVTISHFFTNPMYIISYVVSNDVAFQLYELERAHPGKGLKVYCDNLASTAEGILSFVEEAGLESPFASGRIDKVANMLG